VEDARLRVAARRGGPRRESRPPWFLGEGYKDEASARQRAVYMDLAPEGEAHSAETCGSKARFTSTRRPAQPGGRPHLAK